MSKASAPINPAAGQGDPRLKWQPKDPGAELTRSVPIFDPRDLGPLFAKSVRLLEDDTTVYDDLLSKVTAAIAPRDIIEAIWVKEFVDRFWDSQFYQRMRAGFLAEAQKDVVRSLVKLNERVIAQWVAGDKAATAAIETALKGRGADWDTVRADAVAYNLDKIEQLECLIERAETRRDKALHTLERRRESRVRRLPTVLDGTEADRPMMR
jgi:DNA-binding protein H-NS